jgi:hypothetical protein
MHKFAITDNLHLMEGNIILALVWFGLLRDGDPENDSLLFLISIWRARSCWHPFTMTHVLIWGHFKDQNVGGRSWTGKAKLQTLDK